MACNRISVAVAGIVALVHICASSPSACDRIQVLDSYQEDESSLLQTQARALSPQVPAYIGDSALKLGCPQCKSYPNIIRMGGRARTGLLDRITDFNVWSSVAASLCAKLEVRPPCEKLLHYIYGNMSRTVAWTHYFNILAADGSNMMSPPDNVSGTRVRISMHGSMASRYAAARAAVDSGRAFDWLQDYDWHNPPEIGHVDNLLITDVRRRNCQDTFLQPSADVQNAVAAIHSRLSLKSGKYVALHIRRGDAEEACDSSIHAVSNYVTCSLSKNSSLDAYPVMFFTDEKDPTYLASLTGNLTQALGGHRKIYHGDTEVAAVIHEASNKFLGGPAFVFLTEVVLRHGAAAELMMDRTHCVSCESPQPTPLCNGRCSFQEYAVMAQLSVRPKADAVMWQGGLKLYAKPACEQKTYPSLDSFETDVAGRIVNQAEKEQWLKLYPDQIGQ